ncbi:MAG TPA: Asp-tRNA(Asn)/Glu-tRNA(Gln) amidotransferase subunit GatA [Acidimicrobiia bacterium]|nr:Asp-tRNA(Asn)/Glu-tRNA(Gln) amidotransferase subunit GatA [Acidimicrobiia bacterium]
MTSTSGHLADVTIAEAGERLREGTASAVDLLGAVLERAAFTEAQLHCYLTIDHEGAHRAAETADYELAGGVDRGPLHGIPLALKDNFCTRGVATTCASQILAGYVPPYDGTAVARLRQEGAVIVGKTNLDEFAMGSSTENSAYGPTRNPWNPERVPGGSSGGSAAAVAVGSALGAFGSDTGGSIRQPGSLCGVVGYKPTYGLVSRYGLVAFASSLDQIGPLARTVDDALTLFEAVAGHDPLDATSYPGPVPDARSALDAGPGGLRIGVVKELSGEGYEPEVAAAVEVIVDRLAGEGAEVVEVSLPSFELALSCYYLIAPAEASSNLARFDGVRYGLRVEGETVEEMMARTRAEGFGPEVTRRILLGTYALSAGYYDAFYGQANRLRTKLINDLNAVHQKVDVLMSPTSPTVAFGLGDKTQDPLSMYLADVCTIPADLAGTPAISVPISLDSQGLPIGLQVMAAALGDPVMFRMAKAVESLAGFTARPEIVRAWT